MRTNIKIRLLSPLCHYGDEALGVMQAARTQKYKYKDEFIDIPVYSGNAFRGELRRLIMRDYLDKLGITDEGVSTNLYYMLFTGGALTSGSRYNKVGQKRELRKMCPPLSLFGTALGDQIPEGKMKVAIFVPVCQETADYTGIESNLSFYDMLEDTFYTRKDDLKSKDFNINEMEEKGKKKENPVQMKYEMQGLSAGTELTGDIVIENDKEIEKACLKAGLEKLKEYGYIGGKRATGHGKIKLGYDIDVDTKVYYDYLQENKDTMRNWIRTIEGIL